MEIQKTKNGTFEGYTLNKIGKGDFSLVIRHKNAGIVEISG